MQTRARDWEGAPMPTIYCGQPPLAIGLLSAELRAACPVRGPLESF